MAHPNDASNTVGAIAIKRIAPCTTTGSTTTCPGVYKFGVCVKCPKQYFGRGLASGEDTLQKNAKDSELIDFVKTCLPHAFERAYYNNPKVNGHKSYISRVKLAYQCSEDDQKHFRDFMKAY